MAPSPLPLVAVLVAASPFAQTPLTTELVASGLDNPVYAKSPPGDERIFVVEMDVGLVRIVEDGVLLPAPFLDVSAKMDASLDGGLMSIAFHPDYAKNGLFYVYYTDLEFDSTVERYSVSSGDPNAADAASGAVLLEVAQPTTSHQGGDLHFGPDGYLWMALGDGGGEFGPGGFQPDPDCRAQDPADLLGKVLRLDVDSAFPYAIPPDNPFVGVPGYAPEIWAVGLRNPWRFSFDRETGDVYLGDVGEVTREEINFEPAGSPGGVNYGWSIEEGSTCHAHACGAAYPACGDSGYTRPLYEYDQSFGCSVTGGYVYRGCAIPDLRGTYFYGDYCSGRIWSFEAVGGAVTGFQERTTELKPSGLNINRPVSFGEDGDGELLVIDYLDGELFRVVPAQPPAGLVDCDADGQDDACAIAAFPHLDLDLDGVPDACQSLSADSVGISVTGGGTQNLSLHGGAAVADELYFVGGSKTGTSPGIPIGTVVVPLVYDNYTLLMLKSGNQPPFLNTIGTLDGNGAASAALSVPAGLLPPSAVGVMLFHAYGAFQPSGLVDFASNWVSLQFLP